MTPIAPAGEARIAIGVAAREGVRLVEWFETYLAMYESSHVFEVLLEIGQKGHIGARHCDGRVREGSA